MKRIRINDEVIVIAGKEKGKTGKVLAIVGDRVKIAGLNIIKKHIKPSQQNTEGGIREEEGTIHISNVAHAIKTKGKTSGPSRVKFETIDGKKVRVLVKTGRSL